MLEQARAVIAASINAEPDEIIFTSTGTEANALALLGHKGSGVFVSPYEHSSVSEQIKFLTSRNWEARNENPELVSVTSVCGETGAMPDVAALRERFPDAFIHTDAVQAYCKVPLDVRKLKVDALTISAHKIHGVRGAAALYLRKGSKVKPLYGGGGQERGLRPGTENVPAICAFARAAATWTDFHLTRIAGLKNYAMQKLEAAGAVIIPPHEAPHILAFSLPGIPGQVAARLLSDAGICVSTGSACLRGKPSPVLAAMNLSPGVLTGALRMSFSRENAESDIDAAAVELPGIIKRLGRG